MFGSYGNPVLLFIAMAASLGGQAYKGAKTAKAKFLAREADSPTGAKPLYSQTRSRPAGKAGRVKKSYGHIS